MSQDRKRVAILFGGKSVEHRISINSARNIYQYIDREKFEPILIGISRNGEWFLCRDTGHPINEGQPLKVSLNSPMGLSGPEGHITTDIAFPVLHGTNGEDGSIQGMLQVLEIPFVGTGVLGSAICMSKLLTKQVLEQHGIPTARFRFFHRSERASMNFEELSAELGLPLMVKAVNLGSSVGISKATDKESFEAALDDSFHYDHTVIVEEFISGREIECSVMGNGEPQVSYPGEIIISKDYDFYTFDAKYVDSEAVKLQIPAELSDEVRDAIRESCRKAYLALKCEDFARVDIFLAENGQHYINEINTIPGFTNSSMFPMMWAQHGTSFTGLITQLVEMAIERNLKMREIETNFTSKLDD